MATSKRKGAPASTGVRHNGELTRKVKSVANKALYAEVANTVCESVRRQRKICEQKVDITDWPRKPSYGWGGARVPHTVTPYTNKLDRQLFRLFSTGASLDTVSDLEGLPDLCELLEWLADETHQFSRTFSRARQLVIPLYEDRARDLALNPSIGVTKTTRQVLNKNGDIVTVKETREADSVERAKLGMSAYQWALGWMLPKKHGRQADPTANQPNDQLKALFDSLKSGPAE